MASRSAGVREARLSWTTSCIGPSEVELLAAPRLRKATSSGLPQRLVLASASAVMLGAYHWSILAPCNRSPAIVAPMKLRGVWQSPQWPSASTR